MKYGLVILLAYLLGSSNMALYLSKLRGVDIRDTGSKNPGASNATIVLGWRAGILVGIHDIGKAVAAVLLARYCFPELSFAEAAAGAACVLGHMFPFYMKFRGGKGLAAYIGMTLALNWKLGLAVLVLVVLVTVVSDYIVVGTFFTVAVVPVGMSLLSHSVIIGLILGAASACILCKHGENIRHILQGTEIGLRSTIRGENRIDRK